MAFCAALPASERQLNQRHVAMARSDQGSEIEGGDVVARPAGRVYAVQVQVEAGCREGQLTDHGKLRRFTFQFLNLTLKVLYLLQHPANCIG